MSTIKKPDIAKARLLALKKIGVLKDVSARSTLTKSQKATVLKNWKKYSEIATAPKDTYIKKDISFFENKEKKALEKSGYKIINNKVFIDKQGSDKATVKRISSRVKGVGDKREKYESYLVVERVKGDRKTEQEFIGSGLQKNGWRDKLLSQYQAGQFEKGDYIGIKIEDGGIFRRRMYQSIDDVFKYASDDFIPKDADTEKEYLLERMHLVKMSVKDYRDLASTEKTKKQKNSERYQRAKKAKQLNVSKPKNKLVGKPRRK